MVKKIPSNELMKVSLITNAVMTVENFELFAKEFSKLVHDRSKVPYSERFCVSSSILKKASRCGKYRTGMILKYKYGGYYLVYDIVEDTIKCIQFDCDEYETIKKKCLNYENWENGLPLELLGHTGIYKLKTNFKSDSSGIIDIYTIENMDDDIEILEELNDIILCYLVPEIEGRGYQ